ncbi:MAG: glycosyltransferase family 2 protein [Lachnospiraceae bacterium]|jgi:GT2 family glycosyltransferase|nr:glycosyltransferase family 2 protein [Lachnospiraceae bacterium]
MKTTVIIPNYNGKHFMEACMRALGKQSRKDFCVLIVDNGSSDGSVEWMREHLPGLVTVEEGKHLPLSEAATGEKTGQSGRDNGAKRGELPFPVYLLPLQENTGFSGAVNRGIRASVTEYVILLNNDTEVHRDYIRAMERAVGRDRRIFSVSSRMVQLHDKSLMDDAGDLYTVIGWGFQRGVGQKSSGYKRARRVFAACAGAAIYRRHVFEEIGYFDEAHFAYLEDLDVGYRARLAGYENWYCPAALVYHVGSGTSGSRYNPFKVRLAARNSVYLNYKNMPFLQLLINALPLAFGYAVKIRFFTKRGFGSDYRAGLKEGFTTLYRCRRVPVGADRLLRYAQIELELIGNTFIYAYEYIKRRIRKP